MREKIYGIDKISRERTINIGRINQSARVYERLENWYRQNGYDVVVLPKDTSANRTKFILSEVNWSNQ